MVIYSMDNSKAAAACEIVTTQECCIPRATCNNCRQLSWLERPSLPSNCCFMRNLAGDGLMNLFQSLSMTSEVLLF